MRASVLGIVVCLWAAGHAHAQTTAGIATTVVFPVAAQTASFASEMTLFNPGPNLLTASVKFYEANNSGAPGPKVCNDVSVSAGRSVQLLLATQCALTGSGGHFGLIVVADKAAPQVNAFYGYMRVQNPQGIGFSVEGFPATNFNNQVGHATGLKRKAAAPTFQTNCFVGSLDQPVSYQIKLFNDGTGAQVGGTLSGSLTAFQQFRYLDVFGANGVNAPAGDLANVRAEFTQTSGGSATLIGFCTVQDNTSFSADFRIAKSYGSPSSSFFAQGGNAFGATAHLGTNDNQPLELYANGQRIARYEPDATSPNMVGGHSNNTVSAGNYGQTIAGGGLAGSVCNDAQVNTPTRTCGNQATGIYATIGGGYANVAAAQSTVPGGILNAASAISATVGGGYGNTASGYESSIAGGAYNVASAPWSTVPGGTQNRAGGWFSFAAGNRAVASADGMFAWADFSNFDFDFATYRAPQSSKNTFNVRATGGVVFVTGVNASTGWPTWECYTYNGGGWTCSSDRNLKDNLTQLDGAAVLAKVMAMPIYQWQPKNGPNAKLKHVGPMAQDFYAAFGLGDSDKSIGMQDAEGVALSAIQGLYQVMLEKDARIEAQQKTVEAQQREIDALKDRVASVESVRDEIAALRATMATTRGPTSLATTLH